ncbi:MAG: hypothetical protein K5774_07115 [Clostridia bacterium]|nr:hypothetical protein [Clostridia bacterium]
MSGYNVKNYKAQGGKVTHIDGVLEFGEGATLSGFPGAANFKPKTSNTASEIRSDLNALIVLLKNAGIMAPDEWNLSVLACPTPAAMPTPETAANSAHATVSCEGTEITITLNCSVDALADANHGETWGTHKWLGFGVRTGLASVIGVRFTDDTGASATLTADDATEAGTLGLSAGDFVLYIKAEQEGYRTGDKHFTLKTDGYTETEFTLRIVESVK